MTSPTLSKIALAVLALTAATAHARTFQSVTQQGSQLELRTDDGRYLIKPYSPAIVETSFIPNGEQFDPNSHAVVMAPGAVQAKLKNSGNTIEYSTPGITAVITKSPFRIAYRYKGKPLVAEKSGYEKIRDDVEHGSKDINKGEARELEAIEFALDKNEALYGAGARSVGMNRRGHCFTLNHKA